MSTKSVQEYLRIVNLTDEEKIAILEETKKILGPNGEHWTKACWFGVARSYEEQIEFAQSQFGLLYDAEARPIELVRQELYDLARDNDWEVFRRSLGNNEADKANVWCLMGAIEEAAYRLKIVPRREQSERFADPISLQKLVTSKERWESWTVIDVNDNPNTEWSDVRDLLDERLEELHSGKGDES